MVHCPKYLRIFSKIFLIFIHIELDLPTTKIFFCKESVEILEKNVFLMEGLRSGKKSNSLKILSYVIFCKHYEDHLLNYE